MMNRQQGGGITIEGLFDEIEQQYRFAEQLPKQYGAFEGQTGNGWMKRAKGLPPLVMLFGPFWFKGEICILFASSNQGKTILAVQIAHSISSGIPIMGFVLEAEAQRVAYFDFEMSTKQFELRYSKEGSDPHIWSDNFVRYELNPDDEMPRDYSSAEEYIVDSIETIIRETGTKVIIIDNLTYLSNDTETAKGAAPLMKQLKALKSRYNVSMLILAHTPKRDASKPITQNDLQGSSRLMQFGDSCFAIGASVKGNDVKYIKQIKVRNTTFEFDADNVIVCEVGKENSFLHFERIGESTEREHLSVPIEGDKAELIKKVTEAQAKGMTQRTIASELGLSASTVNRILKSQLS